MLIKNIGFDIDGTLTDEVTECVNFFLPWYLKKTGKKYSGKIHMDRSAIMDRFEINEEMAKEFRDEYWPWYLTNAQLRPYVVELFWALHRMGIKIHIVTARKDSRDLTEQWLKHKGIQYDVLHTDFDEKEAIISGNNIELFVDEQPYFIEKLSDNTPCFIFDTPYNRRFRTKNVWRIESFEPEYFIGTMKYALSRGDYWTTDYEYDPNPRKNKSMLFIVSENEQTIAFNPPLDEKFKQGKNIVFVIPNGNSTNVKEANTIMKSLKKVEMISLFKMGMNPTDLTDPQDEILRKTILKYDKNLHKVEPKSSREYVIKCNIIKDLLKIAESRPEKKWIFCGPEILMLPRDVLKKYKDYPILLTNCSPDMIKRCNESRHIAHHDPWILFEDLFTDLETEVRKWKIIAGTAKKELPHYINRQFTDSDGIDRVELLPGEKPYKPQLLDSILSEDTYVIGDFHLSTKDTEKTKRIRDAVNRTVGRDEHLLILGDMDGKKGTGSYQLCKDFLRSLKCKNLYLILGNNDPYSIEDFAKMGFKTVTDKAVFHDSTQRNIILTHCCYPVNGDDINIHGHIHGSKIYWNMDWENHYDVWDEDFVPIKIGECLRILDAGEYHAKSEIHNAY